MNLNDQHFLSILRSAMLNEPAQGLDALTPENWAGLMELALKHKVLPLFVEAVYPVPSAQAALAQHRTFIMQQVMTQALKTDEFLSLYRALTAAGLQPLVVKGIICRNLYHKPDLRVSADEDLLVRPEQFDAARKAMEDFGMVCVSDHPDANELAYQKPDGNLYIELHRTLFPPREDAYGHWNRCFADAFDRAASEEIQGTAIFTLAPTEHLFYLICHALKHFLHSGFGIRQICDIAQFSNTYGSQINWNQVMELCEEIHALDFAAAIFRIGEKYLTFEPELAHYPQAWRAIPVDEEPLLEDLLSGGIYGTASISRIHGSNITLGAAAASRQGKKSGGALCSSLFPPSEKMEADYPYLKQYPWLLPVAWGHRMVKYGLQACTNSENSALEAMQIGNHRVALLRQYGIIGDGSDSKENEK